MTDLLKRIDSATPNQLAKLLAMGQPAPHAYKRPNISLRQLEALKTAIDKDYGLILADHGTRRALVNRGLAAFSPRNKNRQRNCGISANGHTLIRTQYTALKQVLSEDTHGCG